MFRKALKNSILKEYATGNKIEYTTVTIDASELKEFKKLLELNGAVGKVTNTKAVRIALKSAIKTFK